LTIELQETAQKLSDIRYEENENGVKKNEQLLKLKENVSVEQNSGSSIFF